IRNVRRESRKFETMFHTPESKSRADERLAWLNRLVGQWHKTDTNTGQLEENLHEIRQVALEFSLFLFFGRPAARLAVRLLLHLENSIYCLSLKVSQNPASDC